MKFGQDLEEIKKVTAALEKICEPYGLVAEVATNIRGKYRPTEQEMFEGASTYEIDPDKWDPKKVGFVVRLIWKSSFYSKIAGDGSKIWIILDEVTKKNS